MKPLQVNSGNEILTDKLRKTWVNSGVQASAFHMKSLPINSVISCYETFTGELRNETFTGELRNETFTGKLHE